MCITASLYRCCAARKHTLSTHRHTHKALSPPKVQSNAHPRQSCSCARTSRASWAAWKISSQSWPRSHVKACRCSVVCPSWISSYTVARPAGFPCSMSSNRNFSLRCSCIDNLRVSLPALWNVRLTVCQTADINNVTYYLQDICMCEMAHFQLTWSCQRHVGDVACAFAHNGIHTCDWKRICTHKLTAHDRWMLISLALLLHGCTFSWHPSSRFAMVGKRPSHGRDTGCGNLLECHSAVELHTAFYHTTHLATPVYIYIHIYI
jgi:hypothetical protein